MSPMCVENGPSLPLVGNVRGTLESQVFPAFSPLHDPILLAVLLRIEHLLMV